MVATDDNGLAPAGAARADARVRWLNILWWLPPVAAAAMVWHLGVDAPVLDDMRVGETLMKVARHGLGLGDLVAQHNESRLVFPRLLFWLLCAAGRWDVRAQMACSVAAILLTSVLVRRVCRRTIDGPAAAAATAAFASVLLFSPAQWHNLLWGIQLIVFVPLLAIAVGLVALGPARPLWAGVWVAAAAAVVATYSNSNGMVVWPLLVPAILAHPSPARRRAAAAWAVLAVVSIGAYFDGYERPPWHPSMWLAVGHPWRSARFLLAFLGNGLWPGADPAADVPVGAVGLAAWAAGVACLAKTAEPAARRRGVPWAVVGGYAVASGVLTTLGRLGFGEGAAVADRYCTFAIPLWIAIVPLWAIVAGPWIAGRPDLRRRWLAAAAAAIVAAAGPGFVHGWAAAVEYRDWVLAARSVEQFCEVVPDDEAVGASFCPAVDLGRQVVAAADRLGRFPPGCLRTSDVSAIDGGEPGVGYFDGIRVDGRHLVCNGWACLPPSGRLADAVLLTRRWPDGTERAFAIVVADREGRPGVAAARGRRLLARSGWSRTVDPAAAPPGTVISAWAYDTFRRAAYRLRSTHVVPETNCRGD